jgi:glycosyltransferase involved in cell wall biosynthesis
MERRRRSVQMFQVLPSIMKRIDNELALDVDFCEALQAYMEHFDSVSIACPIAVDTADSGLGRCRLVKDLPWKEDRLRLIPLPNAYRPLDFVRHLPRWRRILRTEIQDAAYLVFSPHTLIGDWPTIAVHEAIKLRRPYVIEADIVYESLALIGLDRQAPWKRFIKTKIVLPLFLRSYRYCLTNSKLALFQGQAVFDEYAPFCSNPYKVHHHIPIYQGDHISDEELDAKLAGVETGEPLAICYAGRAIDMKGPIDWLDVLNELIRSGVRLNATWVGDGSLLVEMRAKAEALGIASHVTFPGFVTDRKHILRTLKNSDIFLYCHKTEESARCLGEALACGCPLVGYASAYAKELVAKNGGGLFAAQGDRGKLVELVTRLDKHREHLRKLITQARTTGQLYDRKARLNDRMELVKQFLHPSVRTSRS